MKLDVLYINTVQLYAVVNIIKCNIIQSKFQQKDIETVGLLNILL